MSNPDKWRKRRTGLFGSRRKTSGGERGTGWRYENSILHTRNSILKTVAFCLPGIVPSSEFPVSSWEFSKNPAGTFSLIFASSLYRFIVSTGAAGEASGLQKSASSTSSTWSSEFGLREYHFITLLPFALSLLPSCLSIGGPPHRIIASSLHRFIAQSPVPFCPAPET